MKDDIILSFVVARKSNDEVRIFLHGPEEPASLSFKANSPTLNNPTKEELSEWMGKMIDTAYCLLDIRDRKLLQS